MPNTKRNILPVLFLAILLAGVCCYGIYTHLEKVRTNDLVVLMDEQEAVLKEYTLLLRSNSASQPVTAIMRDCPADMRASFDAHLARLAELNRSELLELERFFSNCAYFYPNQEAIMTMLLSDAFISYEHLLDMFAARTQLLDERTEKRLLWRKLVDLHITKNALSLELADVQRSILNMLLAGTVATDPTFEAERRKATEILTRTVTAITEIEAIRTELDAL